jgi:hypothetical protein
MRPYWIHCSIVALCLGCGGEKPKPPPPPQPTAAPEPPPPAPTSEPTTAEAQPPPPEQPKGPPPPSGRPAILMGPSDTISSTFGATPGAVLKLKGDKGNITLKISEFSLDAGYNIEWKVAKGGPKGKAPALGTMASLKVVLGGKELPSKVTSRGTPFEVRWPTGDKESVNLAIGEATFEATGESKPTWHVVAPKNVDAGLKEAYFALEAIGPINYLYATTAAPDAPPAEAPAP